VAYEYVKVRASYSGDKAFQERHDVVTRFFSRPLSFPVAWLALQVGLAPNHVTWLSLIMNAAGLGLMASGRRGWMAIGVGVILVALVLDAADGNMARTTKRFSPMGEWLEGVGAYLLCAGFHVAGGIGAWRALAAGDPVTQWPAAPAAGGWLVTSGAIAASGITLSILTASKFSAAYPGIDRGQVVARMGRGAYGALFTVGRNLSFASGLVLPFTLLGILLRRYEVVLVAYALLNTGMFAVLLVRCWLLGVRSTATASVESRVTETPAERSR
jgi:phosphatidylglycerophosphate synthase